ncbi:YjfB family protein [Salinispirillum marinum]|uniref:YjfB family protein n=2 Tax=Saccharospirillaceae TaxID=255527 RepID=A0ABV8BBS4_9GAMM
MDVSSIGSVAAYASSKAMSDAQEGAALKTFKMAVDQQAGMVQQLIQSANPSAAPIGNVGQNIDIRV